MAGPAADETTHHSNTQQVTTTPLDSPVPSSPTPSDTSSPASPVAGSTLGVECDTNSESHDSADLTPTTSDSPNDNKKPRVPTACTWCRRRKRKCNGAHPCNWCIKGHLTCVYTSTYVKRGPQAGVLQQLRQQVAQLTSSLQTERERTRSNPLDISAPLNNILSHIHEVRDRTYIKAYFTLINDSLFTMLNPTTFHHRMNQYMSTSQIDIQWSLQYVTALSLGALIYGDNAKATECGTLLPQLTMMILDDTSIETYRALLCCVYYYISMAAFERASSYLGMAGRVAMHQSGNSNEMQELTALYTLFDTLIKQRLHTLPSTPATSSEPSFRTNKESSINTFRIDFIQVLTLISQVRSSEKVTKSSTIHRSFCDALTVTNKYESKLRDRIQPEKQNGASLSNETSTTDSASINSLLAFLSCIQCILTRLTEETKSHGDISKCIMLGNASDMSYCGLFAYYYTYLSSFCVHDTTLRNQVRVIVERIAHKWSYGMYEEKQSKMSGNTNTSVSGFMPVHMTAVPSTPSPSTNPIPSLPFHSIAHMSSHPSTVLSIRPPSSPYTFSTTPHTPTTPYSAFVPSIYSMGHMPPRSWVSSPVPMVVSKSSSHIQQNVTVNGREEEVAKFIVDLKHSTSPKSKRSIMSEKKERKRIRTH